VQDFRKHPGNFIEADKDAFVDLCTGIINSSSDERIIVTATIALAGMRYKQGMFAIIDSDKVDFMFKSYNIMNHYMVFLDILDNSPTFAELEYTLKALEIFPATQVYNALSKYLERNPDARIVLPAMETRPGDEKYLEY